MDAAARFEAPVGVAGEIDRERFGVRVVGAGGSHEEDRETSGQEEDGEKDDEELLHGLRGGSLH